MQASPITSANRQPTTKPAAIAGSVERMSTRLTGGSLYFFAVLQIMEERLKISFRLLKRQLGA